MKLLLSRRNFPFECQEFWKARRGLSVTLVSANGVRKSIDLLKLSLLSSHVMDLKNSLGIPDTLSHLVDIDLILPDFSENVVRILCDVLEDGDPHVITNIASFNELNELIGLLNVTLSLSLTKVNNDLIKHSEVKVEGFMKGFVEAGDTLIKEKPLKVTKGGENANPNILETPLLTMTTASVCINVPPIKDFSSSAESSKKSTSINKVIETQGGKAFRSTSKGKESEKLPEDADCMLIEIEEDTNNMRTEKDSVLAKKITEMEERAKELNEEKKQVDEQLVKAEKLLDDALGRLNKLKEETIKLRTHNKELAIKRLEKVDELQRISNSMAGSKNILRQVNELKKKTEELEKKKQDAYILLTAAENKHKQEIANLKKDAEDTRASSEDLKKVKNELEEVQKLVALKNAEIETQKKYIAAKESEINKNNTTLTQIKKIGRNYRENAEASEKTLIELTEEKRKVDEQLAKAIKMGGHEAEALRLREEERLMEQESEASQMSSQGTSCSPATFSPAPPTMTTVTPTLKKPRQGGDF